MLFTDNPGWYLNSIKVFSIYCPMTQSTIWVEKYRPSTLSDLCGQSYIRQTLSGYLSTKDLPHLLFHGGAGTGKTSAILSFAKDFYKQYNCHYKKHVLELNASDERGIQVIRDRVKVFAKHKVTSVPFKLIILDEFDAMTTDAQAALRRVMEDNVQVTRFCLFCNYIAKVIDPIKSRCASFQFKPLEDKQIIDRLQMVCKEEQLGCTSEQLTMLMQYCEGDLRKCIYSLQTMSQLENPDIEQVLGFVPRSTVLQLLHTLKAPCFADTTSLVQSILLDGYSAIRLLEQLGELIMMDMEIEEDAKAKCAIQMGQSHPHLMIGDGRLQINGALASLHRLIHNK